MKNLREELQELKDKVADLESRIVAEPVKWQPKGGDWYVGYGGVVVESTTASSSRAFGLERATREQAQRAAVEMRRFNRLLALRDELCNDDVVDWGDQKYKHYVYFSHSDRQWRAEFNDDYESIMPYFTTKELAQKACEMLNSGKVEL